MLLERPFDLFIVARRIDPVLNHPDHFLDIPSRAAREL
jgi:hypothetical protein